LIEVNEFHPKSDNHAHVDRSGDKDASKFWSWQPKGGRKFGATSCGIGDLRQERRCRVWRAKPCHGKPVALGFDRFPHAQVSEHSQGVTLKCDPGSEGGHFWFLFDKFDVDSLFGKEDRGSGTRDASPDYEHIVYSGHGNSFSIAMFT
jgi:hypothetical protein